MQHQRIIQVGLSAAACLSILALIGAPKTSTAEGGQKKASHDVGVIPNLRGECPADSETVEIYMDDEDTSNSSELTGWTGATVQNQGNTGTRFQFCRVDGDLFQPHPLIPYAVLMLDGTCPDDSRPVHRHFDNQNSGNSNSSIGNIWPSGFGLSSTDMVFCHFDPGGTLSPDDELNPIGLEYLFPDLGFDYGVFAPAHDQVAFGSGVIHTDDENTFNGNEAFSGMPWSPGSLDNTYINVYEWLTDDEDTWLDVALVRSSDLPYGFDCEFDQECVSGICFAGQVCGNPLGYGSTCTRDLECLSGICFAGQVCGNPLGNGSTCTRDVECLSGICFDGQVCADPLGPGSTCTRDIECVNSCVAGECT